MRISDWSSDVCSSDLLKTGHIDGRPLTYNEAVEAALGKSHSDFRTGEVLDFLPYYGEMLSREIPPGTLDPNDDDETRWGKIRSEEHTSELQSLMRISYAVFCLKKKKTIHTTNKAQDNRSQYAEVPTATHVKY